MANTQQTGQTVAYVLIYMGTIGVYRSAAEAVDTAWQIGKEASVWRVDRDALGEHWTLCSNRRWHEQSPNGEVGMLIQG